MSAADHTRAECQVCGFLEQRDELVALRDPELGLVAHCPRCAADWRRRYEAARQGAMK